MNTPEDFAIVIPERAFDLAALDRLEATIRAKSEAFDAMLDACQQTTPCATPHRTHPSSPAPSAPTAPSAKSATSFPTASASSFALPISNAWSQTTAPPDAQ